VLFRSRERRHIDTHGLHVIASGAINNQRSDHRRPYHHCSDHHRSGLHPVNQPHGV